MMKQLLTTLLSGLPALLIAQPVLNASLAPSVNSMFIYHDANVPSPAFTFSKTGTNNTWDFTGITPVPGADDTVFIVDPATVPGGNNFPTATHARYEGDEISYTMMQIDASGITLLGAMGDPTGGGNLIPLVATPPLLAMPFPYSYGSSASGSTYFQVFATGAAIGQPSVDSVRYKSTIIGSRDVIAAGNIIIPAGTFPALLERSIDTNIDTLWIKGAITFNQWTISPGFPTSTTDSAFYWYSDQSLLQYAHALYDNTGLHDVTYFKSTVSAIDESSSPAISVYPNPVSGLLYFDNADTEISATVYNSNGQLLLSQAAIGNKLDVSGLQNGIYIVRLSDSTNRTKSLKFIKD